MDGVRMVLPLALAMAVGYFARERGILPREMFSGLNQLLFRVALPALLFRTTMRVGGGVFENTALFFAVYSTFFAVPIVAWLLGIIRRLPRERLAVSVFVSFRANNVFMGIPAVMLALGDAGLDALSVFLAMGLPGYHIVSIAWAQLVLSGGLSVRALLNALKSVARNPLVVACLAGICVAYFGMHELPKEIDVAFKTIGDMSSGLALLLLGASLEPRRFLSSLRASWMDVLFKLFVHPAIVWCAFLLWPVSSIMEMTVILTAALPVAVNCYIVADAMKMDAEYTAELIAASTFLSVLTLPIWMRLLVAI